MSKLGNLCSGVVRTPNETMRLLVTIFVGIVFGFFIGVSFPTLMLTRFKLPLSLIPSIDLSYIEDRKSSSSTQTLWQHAWTSAIRQNRSQTAESRNLTDTTKIWIPTNPRGAERLPPSIVAAESDFYLRRLWGKPSEDLSNKPKYLVTFTVGSNQKRNIDAAVKKVSQKRNIDAACGLRWFAKRFLHPDIVALYDYIFLWDEDLGVEHFNSEKYIKLVRKPFMYDYIFLWDEGLGVEHFNSEKYIKLVRKHGLEISQPGVDPDRALAWQMTKRRDGREVHKETKEKPGWCANPHLPPCAAFVEIMAPVFSREAWRCVWHMLQNDLVHGWGLDFALRRCIEPAHEKIGVVDSQWIVHQSVPSLGTQDQSVDGKAPLLGVRERCEKELTMFQG